MMIDFTPDGVETGDILGMFYIGDEKRDQQMLYMQVLLFGTIQCSAAMTILGNVSNGYGMEEGSPL